MSAASQRFTQKEPALQVPELDESRVETITACLLYLMTHYARTGCPQLAVCVSRHMQCLALHPDAAPLVRDICASLHGTWARAGGPED